jgi:bifunctional DNA-binding transcriptional regulator/antitoxin component of YhaV-PrlF toxin-antitoxin module
MIIELQEDGDDLILPFPDDILDKIGWKEGDSLEWVDNQDGSFTLRKV